MRKILGLDIGTNSIGWAVIDSVVNSEDKEELRGISSAGSRIIPMDAGALSDFDKGNTKSQTSDRTSFRGKRRLLQRKVLRRERLHRVLARMSFLPEHYLKHIDRFGKFIDSQEPKMAWCKDDSGKQSFLFMDAFNEMLSDFRQNNPDLIENGKKVPYDWTLYYLRKKALRTKVSKEELAWILLSFNQKRGYYQLRGEEEEEDNKKDVKYYALKVISVEDSGERKGKDIWYNVYLENGFVYRRASSVPLDWVGKVKEFVVTTELDDNGQPKRDKNGEVKRSFRAPAPDEWALVKVRTQEQIDKSGKTVGEYIYDSLLGNPMQKVRGKLVHTIDRRYYKDELYRILEEQKKYHEELRDASLLAECVAELYQHNESHRNILLSKGFTNFLLNDILFYQRPLKSKKSLIDDCQYEYRVYKKDGKLCKEYLKCAPKSHPLYQEFRIWQFISSLRIYKREMKVGDALKTDVDVTHDFLSCEDDYVKLYDILSDMDTIEQKTFLALKFLGISKKEQSSYRWNYVEDKKYPCGSTRAQIISRLKKAGVNSDFLTKDAEIELWHILYSVSDRTELYKALKTFASKNSLDDAFAEALSKMPAFDSEYGAYSLKALKKLLPLMRMGKYWNEDAIDEHTRKRIEKIITGEYDENIRNRVREKSVHLTDVTSFRGLPLWLACYVVYDRHSESGEDVRWKQPSDIDDYLKKFKQHSLRNPVVEQVIMETLRVVRDIWQKEGQIDEIHVELGREMKNPSDKRKKMTAQMLENEYTNLRIKAMLLEFMNPEFGIENVRPNSPSQQDILRIYEEGAIQSCDDKDMPEDIVAIIKKFRENDFSKRPTRTEVMRYKLWLEQRYLSPYTGKPIPLAKLFTPAYQIEHVIPRSRYFDDSLSNKVICEAAVNREKGNMLAYEFIKNCHGKKIELGGGDSTVNVFEVEEYEKFVKDHYAKNNAKLKKLLLEDIPDAFIERQMNDTRYISKVVKSLLSNIVREEGEQEATSKNLVVCTGGITDRLKKDWGINDVWNRIILPRFQRLNAMTGTSEFTAENQSGHLIPIVPLRFQKGFSKKRIDHRHHAMDAIVIACADRNIVNDLNNLSACSNAKLKRQDLQQMLCDKVKTSESGSYTWLLRKPWATFTQDVYSVLSNIIVSFKQNLRVINRTSNKYQHYDDLYLKKIMKLQSANENCWAIRKSLHKDTYYGQVNLRRKKSVPLKVAIENIDAIVEKSLKKKLKELITKQYGMKDIMRYFEENADVWQDINFKKIDIYYFANDSDERFFATRKPLDTSFGKSKIEDEITDTGIQKILLKHLQNSGGDPQIAFSPDGIERMNQNLSALNNGKPHLPIYKVRLYKKGGKFVVGQRGNKISKFVEASEGTNLFFAVYESMLEDKKTGDMVKKRRYETISLADAIRQQKEMALQHSVDVNESNPTFVLSPNDLVYLQTIEEMQNGKISLPIDTQRVYKVVCFTDNRLYAIPYSVASVILDKFEYNAKNKIELTDDKISIKERCIPLDVDRLGNVVIKP